MLKLYGKRIQRSYFVEIIDQVLEDEGLDLNVFNLEWDFLTTSFSKPDFSRNPYVDVNRNVQAFLVEDPFSSHRNLPPATLNLKMKFKIGGNMIEEDVAFT